MIKRNIKQRCQLVERSDVTDISVDNSLYTLMSDNMVKINFPNTKNASLIHINDIDPLLPSDVIIQLKKITSED
jgi:hypothetical protein